jgi:GNAT superfamily N-acetyltransferase
MANTEAPAIEPIDPDHAEAVWPLSIEAGWNQNVADWRFMLGAGRGFGCTAPDGAWQASSLVLPLGQKLAWISMVLVTKDRRRGGLGTGLLKRCIDEVRGVDAVPGLDATEQGRPIYLGLGFHDLYTISRWHLDPVMKNGAVAPPAGITVRPFAIADLPKLAIYDRPLSSLERPTVLAHLALRQPGLAFVAETGSGRIAGFTLGREGRFATSIGPVVADSEAVALALISRAACAKAPSFIIDIPDAHARLRTWLEGQGATSPRAYTRMTLGVAKGLDDASHVFALAGPELG